MAKNNDNCLSQDNYTWPETSNYYTLPNSRVEVPISYKRFLRPDTEADPRILMPDICTEYGEDIPEKAVVYLNSR